MTNWGSAPGLVRCGITEVPRKKRPVLDWLRLKESMATESGPLVLRVVSVTATTGGGTPLLRC